jgi:hypothetical protein
MTIGKGCWIDPGARVWGDYCFREKYADLARRYPAGWVPEGDQC